MLAAHHGIQVLEELNRLQVLVSAVLVRHPLTVAASVVQIEDRSDSVHTQSVHMELLNPEQRIADEEILHFALPEVKDLRPPVRMLALAGVRVLIARLSVEVRQTVRVLRKMRRHPVEDDADAVAVQVVDHVRKILRRSIAAGRCEITRDLITPGTVEGVLRDTHQLNVGIAHFLQILGDGMGKVTVIIKTVFLLRVRMTHPAANVALIDRDRTAILPEGGTLLHPHTVCPADRSDVSDHGSGTRPLLCLVRVWVGLVKLPAVRRVDQILVHLSQLRVCQEALPDSGGVEPLHRDVPLVPAVELADQMDRSRVRRPYRKVHALHTALLRRVRAQLFEDIVMHALVIEVLIQVMDEFIAAADGICSLRGLLRRSLRCGGLCRSFLRSGFLRRGCLRRSFLCRGCLRRSFLRFRFLR